MSLYGYPREPEAAGDDNGELYPLPSTVSADPLAARAPVTPPPQPLLPADPPGFSSYPASAPPYPASAPPYPAPAPPYPGATGPAPGQRPAPETESWLNASPEPPTDGDSAPSWRNGSSGRHRGDAADEPTPGAGTASDSPGSEFQWLRPRPAGPEPPGFGPSPSMGQPSVARPVSSPPGFGPSPSMGQPAVPVGTSASPFGRPPATGDRTGSPLNRASAIRTAAGAGANEANGTGPSMVAVPGLDEEALAALLHEPEGTPSWDRRPLFIVIVSAVVLVLIGVAVGFAVAAFGPRSDATWREGTPGPHSSAHSAPLTRGGTSRP